MKSLKPKRRSRLNYLALLAVSLVCLLLLFASHRFGSATGDFYTVSNSAALSGGQQTHFDGVAGHSAATVDVDDELADQLRSQHLNVLRANARAQDYRRHHFRNRPRYGPSGAFAASSSWPIAARHHRPGNSDETGGVTSASSSAYQSPILTMTTDELLAMQRERISADMQNFEFIDDASGGPMAKAPRQSLRSLAPETNGQPMRSIVITTWRSGSTFLGDILNALPSNFYHYEPLLNYDIRSIRPDDADAERAVGQLRQLLACNYSGTAMTEYLEFGREHNYLHNHNTRLWRYCRLRPELCAEGDFLGAFCGLFPLQSMKSVRLRLALVEPLLEAAELGGTVRVVLLVRDPRGVLQSRKHRDWCPGRPDCDRPERLCADMVADYRAAKKLMRKWPGRVKWMRYEDLSVEPYARTQELLSFYGLPFDPAVEEFLDSHTRSDVGGVSSTFRDSKSAPFHWMADLSWREVKEIQSGCGQAMRLWGYREAESRAALRQRSFSPLGNVTLWSDDNEDGDGDVQVAQVPKVLQVGNDLLDSGGDDNDDDVGDGVDETPAIRRRSASEANEVRAN